MPISKQTVARKLFAYLQHRLSLAELVEWAENALLECDFAETDIEVLTSVLGQLGLADVRAFGLTWEDCQNLMQQLGFDLQVAMAESA
ncbi:MAG: hypothetical protein KF734_16495 [Saprospiraceae bacterium]|nr:hypothetical protein [Saprospiraceae bacterium]